MINGERNRSNDSSVYYNDPANWLNRIHKILIKEKRETPF